MSVTEGESAKSAQVSVTVAEIENGLTYTIDELEGGPSLAYSININGQIAGGTTTEQNITSTAFFWNSPKSPQMVAGLGGSNGRALGINSAGHVAGAVDIIYGGGFFSADGQTTILRQQAYGINDSDQVAMGSGIWQNGNFTDLGVSQARSINNKGQVAGTTNKNHAFLYSDNTTTDLGTLGGSGSSAFYLNDDGLVVGDSETLSGGNHHAFLWDGTMHDLGTLQNDETSAAYCINRNQEVVGLSATTTKNVSVHAVLWKEGKIIDLNTLLPPNSGWELNYATAINDKSQIVGYGSHNGTSPRAFLLTPR